MTKVDIRRLDSVTTNDTTATQLINANFEALQTAIENTLSRDGTTPNFLDADIDLNSYKIINAGTPTNNTDVITKEYFDQNVGDAAGYATAAAASATQAHLYETNARDFASIASGAAGTAQTARDTILDDAGFIAVSTDLLQGEDSVIKKTSDDLTNVDTVASNIADVNATAASIADVNTVAADITNVNTTATNIADVNTTAGSISSVNTTAGSIANVNTTATNINSVNTTAASIANVNTTATNISNVNTVAGISSNVTTVAGIASDVTTVSGVSSDVTTVATDIASVNTVAANDANVTAVAGNNTNITAVANNETNINAVNANKTNIDTVAANNTNVTAVATDIANVNAVAADLTNIDAASSYAAAAKQWAVGDPSEPSGNSAKWWAEHSGLPSQAGHSGQFLTTDGSGTSWGTVDVSGAINTHDTSLTAHDNKFQVVTSLPATPTAGVFYFVKA